MTDRRLRRPEDLDGVAFDASGLVPVVAQDARDGRVLMLAWADREALRLTLETGQAHFWSRSRQALWRKGETSGNTLALVSLHADCDADTVLARVRPAGPACHTGSDTCFGGGAEPEDGGDALAHLAAVVRERARSRPEGSYTTRLLDDRNLRVKKLGEENAELIQALVEQDPARAAAEAADLVYHLAVALEAAGTSLDAVRAELERRRE